MTNEKIGYKQVYYITLFTIIYNFIEGLLSVYFGITDETLTLFGFGLDSFIETISGLGILQMIRRIQQNPNSTKSSFEIKALRITGYSFYALVIVLGLSIFLNLIYQHKPETTFWGIIISLISIIVMYFLVKQKIKIGNVLNFQSIIADAKCTQVCIYMSIVMLIASLVYELTGFAYTDSLGTLGIMYFAFNEGKESFGKAKGIHQCSCAKSGSLQTA
jgi:divalent metal cation (Fe/Co/Zn/Cd) transporter